MGILLLVVYKDLLSLCSFIKFLRKDLNFVCFTQRKVTGSFQNKWVCFVLNSMNLVVKFNSLFVERLGLCVRVSLNLFFALCIYSQ